MSSSIIYYEKTSYPSIILKNEHIHVTFCIAFKLEVLYRLQKPKIKDYERFSKKNLLKSKLIWL